MAYPFSRLKQHIVDAAGASAASVLATGLDGAVFALLHYALVGAGSTTVELAAGAAALVGGAVHYLVSRFWVFRRFEVPVGRSLMAYFTMSWLAALLHALLVGWLVGWLSLTAAWLASKLVVWSAWTYPASRFVVFGGLAATGARRATEGGDGRLR